jgi:hypothetical protein
METRWSLYQTKGHDFLAIQSAKNGDLHRRLPVHNTRYATPISQPLYLINLASNVPVS